MIWLIVAALILISTVAVAARRSRFLQ